MANAAVVIEVEEVPIERIALDDADGDPQAAVEILTERILAQPEIVQAHLPEWARAWAHQKIHGLISSKRQAIIRAVNSNTSFTDALGAAMQSNYNRLMDMPIFGGAKRLADATPEEVRESAARYQSLAAINSQQARFQRKVADEAEKKGEGTIGKVLTEEALTRIWSEADA